MVRTVCLCVAIFVVAVTLLYIFGGMSNPKSEYDQRIDDEEQMAYLRRLREQREQKRRK